LFYGLSLGVDPELKDYRRSMKIARKCSIGITIGLIGRRQPVRIQPFVRLLGFFTAMPRIVDP
jgi:hypothetical protein